MLRCFSFDAAGHTEIQLHCRQSESCAAPAVFSGHFSLRCVNTCAEGGDYYTHTKKQEKVPIQRTLLETFYDPINASTLIILPSRGISWESQPGEPNSNLIFLKNPRGQEGSPICMYICKVYLVGLKSHY